jgi:hypothetical protein
MMIVQLLPQGSVNHIAGQYKVYAGWYLIALETARQNFPQGPALG